MQENISRKKIGHIIVGGTIGNLTEWYNFLLYGYLASVISQLFFPVQNKLLSLTLVFMLFALSFLVRPLGGILFGWIGDTYGRQRALIISLLLLAIPTFLIGCLPTYQTIGIASPILLSLLRICQGLSAGGEHTGSAVYVAEYAPNSRRSLWVSTVPTSAALGILISSATALLIVNSFSNQQLLAWGWRTGFWIGTLLCVISIVLRISLPETPYFQKKQHEPSRQRLSISTLLNNSEILKKILLVFCFASSWGIFYQILFIWMPTYLSGIQHLSNSVSLKINSICMILFTGLVLLVGFCADYVSRKLFLSIACLAMLIFSYPLFTLLSSGSLGPIYCAMIIFTLIFSLYLPTAFVCMVELFPLQIRYTALSFGFNIGLAIFGGTCPLIATWLIESTHNNNAPAFYMMLAAVVALLGCFFFEDKRGKQI
jgi:MHS family proline/betaine transporter-like MFS transporter